MSQKFIMTQDGSINHKSGSGVSGGSFSIISVPSTKWKIKNKGIYYEKVTYTFSGGNASGFINGTVQSNGPQEIQATSTHSRHTNKKVMRVDDFATMNCTGTLTSNSPGTTTGVVEVDDAGQDKWKTE